MGLARRNAHHGSAWRNIADDDRATTHYRAPPDDYGPSWHSILDDGTRTYPRVVLDMHVAINANLRSECHIVADDAIMADMGIDIALKLTTYLH